MIGLRSPGPFLGLLPTLLPHSSTIAGAPGDELVCAGAAYKIGVRASLSLPGKSSPIQPHMPNTCPVIAPGHAARPRLALPLLWLQTRLINKYGSDVETGAQLAITVPRGRGDYNSSRPGASGEAVLGSGVATARPSTNPPLIYAVRCHRPLRAFQADGQSTRQWPRRQAARWQSSAGNRNQKPRMPSTALLCLSTHVSAVTPSAFNESLASACWMTVHDRLSTTSGTHTTSRWE